MPLSIPLSVCSFLFAQVAPAQQPAADAATAAASSYSGYVNLAIFFGILIVSFVLGSYLAKGLRLADYSWKFGLILFATLLSAVIVYRGWPPKLGIDLGGGAILVYQVDPERTPGGALEPDKMDTLISSISKRVNPGGQKEISVRSLGNTMVQITMPAVGGGTAKEKQMESDAIKHIIQAQGSMEFRILADRIAFPSLVERALSEPKTKVLTDSKGQPLAQWFLVRKDEERSIVGDMNVATRPAGDRVEALVLTGVNDPYDVKGDYLKQATEGTDQYGQPCVKFNFDSTGAKLFGQLTGDHLPREGGMKYRLAIVMDEEIQTAPSINSQISDSGEITGSFTFEEVKELVRILNAGSLPAALIKQPVRDMITGPTLGGDTIQKSAIAMVISSILVPLFMFWYYRFAGFVAIIALVLNMLILVAIMILVKAPFTLPAIAGLALTIGMDVDNNVLIYERLREELAHGAALRMAIRNAFHRAGVVIIDANITHIIAAVVLFAVGTEQVKGFAVTFLLGAVLSIWATMFVAHVMFEIAERKRWITKIKMMHIIGHTQIDFMGWFRACFIFSVVITVLGIVVAFYRGKGLFDIDFTGGVSVQAVFKDQQKIQQVRDKIDSVRDTLKDGTVSNVQLQGEAEGQRFVIDTSNDDQKEVRNEIQTLFAGQLVPTEMSFEIVPVTAPSKPAPAMPEEKPIIEPGQKAGAKPQAKPEAKPETKPETKPVEKAKPETKPADSKKQSRTDLPPDSLVAMAGPEAVLLAQAEKPDSKKPEVKTDAKPEPKTEAKPVPKPQAKTDAKPEPKASEVYQAELKFHATITKTVDGKTEPEAQEVRFDARTLEEKVKAALEANQIPAHQVRVEVSNPKATDRTSALDNWTLRLESLPGGTAELTPAKVNAVLATLGKEIRNEAYFPGVDKIGGAVASDTRYYAVIALVSSWALIILYLWIRFQGVAFGLAAVIALVHDVLVMLGAIAFSVYVPAWIGHFTLIEPFKINLPIVAAFMTIIGYSVNDTIIIFDRIREIRGKAPIITRQMVNDATNLTLGRTLLTSFTVLLVVVILYIFGGQAVHGFAFALIIGVATGTYSSIYVAAPILLWLVHPKEMRASSAGAGLQKSRQ